MKKTYLKRKVSVSPKTPPTRRVIGKKVSKATKKKKPPTISKLKKKLDTLFSLYIRGKYPKECYTCGNTGVRLQNGHFVTRMYLATRWEEDNCRPQCRVCNCMRQGMPIDFEERLRKELGNERVEEMKASRKQITKLDEAYYLENIAKYKALLEE